MEKCEDCGLEATYICVCIENHLCEECLIEHITEDKSLTHRTVSLSHPLLTFLLDSAENADPEEDELENINSQIKALQDFRDKCLTLLESHLISISEPEHTPQTLRIPTRFEHKFKSITPIPAHSAQESMISGANEISVTYSKPSPRKQDASFYNPGSIYRSDFLNSDNTELYSYKLCVSGGPKVGKSCIIGSFKHLHENCVLENVSFVFRNIRFENVRINLEVVETRMGRGCEMALGALVVFDLTDTESFHVAQQTMDWIERTCKVMAVVILVGTRLDLVVANQHKRVASFVAIQNYAMNRGALYDEISAVNCSHVEELFMRVVRELYKKSNS
jgi:hypothetical protein